jgi:hypothetical protein
MCRAANALHAGILNWLETASNDIGLQRVIASWDGLPAAIRKAIVALIDSREP